MHNDRYPPLQPIGQGVAAPAPDGNGEIRIIRKGRTHNRHGKTILTVRLHQTFFAGNFFAGILPVWVVQRRGLRNEIVSRRLLIRRGGADEDILLDPAGKESQVALDIIRRVRDPVHDDIKLQVLQSGADVLRLPYVGSQSMTTGQMRGPRSAIEQIELESPGDRLPTDRRADEAGAAAKQHSNSRIVLLFECPRPSTLSGRSGSDSRSGAATGWLPSASVVEYQ